MKRSVTGILLILRGDVVQWAGVGGAPRLAAEPDRLTATRQSNYRTCSSLYLRIRVLSPAEYARWAGIVGIPQLTAERDKVAVTLSARLRGGGSNPGGADYGAGNSNNLAVVADRFSLELAVLPAAARGLQIDSLTVEREAPSSTVLLCLAVAAAWERLASLSRLVNAPSVWPHISAGAAERLALSASMPI